MAPTFTACARSLEARGTVIWRTQWNTDRCTCEVPIHVIPDWPIRDHMQSSKQDVTSDIIAYYV
ncbi:unnamed protein product [Staurois parvus]|uniref:Uncharacterized protein n=1 Tax=Staurois parvus TaxID=386267 RepID=A0ABN9C1I2_9NEOB|nr:unnamed protein product [Staurois parvus]